jgi:hypothetical protein
MAWFKVYPAVPRAQAANWPWGFPSRAAVSDETALEITGIKPSQALLFEPN